MPQRTSTFWAFIVILVLLDLTLRVALGLAAVPDLIMVAVLLGARRLEAPAATLFGLVLGLVVDSVALVAFGASAVAFVVIAWVGSRSRDMFEGDSYLFMTVYAFVGAWCIHAIRHVIAGYASGGVDVSGLLLPALLDSLYVAIATIIALIAWRAVTGNR